MTAPERSLLQRKTALEKANAVRARRAQLKRDLKAKRTSGVALLDDPPEWLETMKVIDFLLALPKVGQMKAIKVLNKCRMSPSKTIGGMTQRQRTELCLVLKISGWRQ